MISVIIPHYPIEGKPKELLERCVASLHGNHELILVVNEGIGFAKAVNIGLKLAKGDYLMVLNDDITLTGGTLEMLCKPGVVTSPVVNEDLRIFSGGFFCIPREVYEKIGGLDEQFKIACYEDDDYIYRLREAGIPIEGMLSVSASHPTGGNTTNRMEGYDAAVKENREKFFKKWGEYPSNDKYQQ